MPGRKRRPTLSWHRALRQLPLFFVVWAILAGTVLSSASNSLRKLKTFQTHSCDGNYLHIQCWPDTVINIYLAQYGRQVSYYELCFPPPGTDPYYLEKEPTDCLSSEALKSVKEQCREQRVCTIKTTPDTLGGDPCPGVYKYIEVAYKCHPKTLITKVVCEGEQLTLKCPKSLSIITYSAFFGGVPEGGDTACPRAMDMSGRECEDHYSTDVLRRECQGRNKCTMVVGKEQFGSPRCFGSREPLFLKVDYTCAPKEVLKSADYPSQDKYGDEERDYFVVEGEGSYFTESPRLYPGEDLEYAIKTGTPYKHVPSDPGWTVDPRSDMQSDEITNDSVTEANCTTHEGDKTVGLVTEWISAYKFISDNREKFILYLTLSVGVGLVAFLVVLSGRLYWQNRNRRQVEEVKLSKPAENAFEADLCEIDQPEIRSDPKRTGPVTYVNCHSLQRPASNTFPRTPLNQDIANHYYS